MLSRIGENDLLSKFSKIIASDLSEESQMYVVVLLMKKSIKLA